jgi:hypothetical protein
MFPSLNEKRKRVLSHVWFNLSSSISSFRKLESDLSDFKLIVAHTGNSTSDVTTFYYVNYGSSI